MKTEVKHQLTKIFLLLFGVFSTLLIALAFKFYYAFSTTEDIITDRYYEIGANYDLHLKETSNSPDRAITFSPDISDLKSGRNTIQFNYFSKTENKSLPVSQGDIYLEITKRATLKDRIQKQCRTDESGICEISFDLSPGSRYDVNILARDTRGKFKIDRTIRL